MDVAGMESPDNVTFQQEGIIVLDSKSQSLETLRHQIQGTVTSNRGERIKWENINAIADVDRVAQASIVQGEFLRRTNGGVPATTQDGGERQYKTFEHFRKDAMLCLCGWDSSKRPMSQAEELAFGWALFNHARCPKEVVIFGNFRDQRHTGVVKKYGVTNEHFSGGILDPGRWNPFINDCWVLGGIKAGTDFVPVTDFVSRTRKELAAPGQDGGTDEIRNDVTELDPSGRPFHFIVTMSSTEFYALKECGYEQRPHPVYGQVFEASQDPAFVQKRANYTPVDMRVAAETMRVTQAIDNLDGERSLAEMLMGFLKRPCYSEPDQKRFDAYIASLKTGGVAFSDPTNARIRKTDLAVAMALGELSRNESSGPRSPVLALRRGMMQAISGAVRHTAILHFEKHELDQRYRDLLLLAIDKRIAVDVNEKKFGESFSFATFTLVEEFIDEHKGSVKFDPILALAEAYINFVKPEFESGMLDHEVGGVTLKCEKFEPADLDTGWRFFRQELGYRLASATSADLSNELGGLDFVVQFLEDFKAVRYVEVPP